MEAIKKVRPKGLRLYLTNKIKKFGVRNVALAVQTTLHLFRTGSFDLRTMTMLLKPMRKQKYDQFRESVNLLLNKLN